MYLLDTCTFIWLVCDQNKLSKKTKEILQQNDQDFFLSSIAGFEIGTLIRKKKIIPPTEPDIWISAILNVYSIQQIPVDYKISLESTRLPLIHNDPIDRIIIATAIEKKLTILTPDKLIRAYKGVKTLW